MFTVPDSVNHVTLASKIVDPTSSSVPIGEFPVDDTVSDKVTTVLPPSAQPDVQLQEKTTSVSEIIYIIYVLIDMHSYISYEYFFPNIIIDFNSGPAHLTRWT